MEFRPGFEELYALSFITRYSNMPRIRNESVAEHCFFVASIAIQMRQIIHFDLPKVVVWAVIHDWPEAKVDDVSHKVKRDFPAVKKALKEAEKEIVKTYAEELHVQFERLDDDVKNMSINQLILHLSDAAQCVQYSATELRLGNNYMARIYVESKARCFYLIKQIPEDKFMLGYDSTDLIKALGLTDVVVG